MNLQINEPIFKDLLVVELASVLAGPAVGLFFAELGARVIKIENPKTKGDVTRHWKHSGDDVESSVSSYYASVNAFKENIFCDIGDELGYSLLIDYIRLADVVIMNFKEGDQEKFNLKDDLIQQINPKLIIGKITGFSSMPERTAYDVVLQAECGFMSMNGTSESGPLKMPVAIIDIMAAHQLKEGILLALMKRMITSKGSVVTVSLEDSGIASLANQASSYLMTQRIPTRMGSLHPTIAPYGEILTCNDGKSIVLAVGSDKQFKLLIEILQIPEFAEDERFKTNLSRVEYREILLSILQDAAIKFDRDTLLHLLLENHIPCGAIKSLNEVFNDSVISNNVITDYIENSLCMRVKTVAFKIH